MTEHYESSNEQAYLEIPVDTPPARIVSVVPSMTETLFELNLGNRVIGRTVQCVYPEDKVALLQTVGDSKALDVASIIKLRPDLVIANQEENRQEDIEALKEAGIPSWVTFPKTIPDVFNVLWNLMYVCEETTMVPRVRLMEYTYDWVLGTTKAQEGVVCRVYAPISAEPMKTFNHDTYSHDLLAVSGGENVFADHMDRYPEVTWEDVEKAQPDVIILPVDVFAERSGDLANFAAMDTPAARSNRIHLVDGRLLTWHGIRLAFALEQIPPLLNRDLAAS